MISRLSSIITEALCNSQVVDEADRELYVYGFFVLLSQGLFFLISVLFGCIFGTLWESIVFFIMFSTVRCYAGGFHASKESVCTCCTTAMLFLASMSICVLEKTESVSASLYILVISSVVVYLLSPLASEDKPLSINETLEYTRISRVIVIAIGIIAIIGVFLRVPGILYAASISMVSESCLLVLGKVKMKPRYHNDH